MLRKTGLIGVFLVSLAGFSQTTWEINAKLFISIHTSVYDYDFEKLDKTIGRATEFINSFNDSADKKVLADVYFLRAELQSTKFLRLFERKEDIGPDNKLFLNTESDFNNAIELCTECNCKYLQGLKTFYYANAFFRRGDRVDSVIKSIGGPGETRTRLGIGFTYYYPANLISGELCILGRGAIRQKKQIHPVTKKKFRNCSYEYPYAIGLFAIGYERSIDLSSYQAFKIDPIWVSYVLSLHPAQFLYSKTVDVSTFAWRPEIGLNFSTLSINYAYQLNFKHSFGPNTHLLSLKLYIPTVSVEIRTENE